MLLPVLSLAYDTDSKQTRERTQTLFRHCNAAGGRLPAAIEVFSGGQCGLRLQAMPMAMELEGAVGAITVSLR